MSCRNLFLSIILILIGISNKIHPDAETSNKGVDTSMIPLELMTLAGGSVAGFIFRYMAERAKERQEQFVMLMEKEKFLEASREAAACRDGDTGKFVRRTIVLFILFAVILAPFWMALIGKNIIVEYDETLSTYFFGLFGGGTTTKFIELPSYLLVPEVRQSLMAIIGYYFGSATAASKN